ncbi:MAG TPA: alpha/beta hydrolase-fold protein [Bryobacteraceae bacterium]|jgi:esterase/lipase superfamily enzyme|nr:alpha/beta hydrolase-fold protein [Bryobacteraceae bacterium]
MELLVFGHAGARVLVFPTREGRFYDYEDWGLVRALEETIEAGNIQLYCLDSVDSEALYCRNCPPRVRLARHSQYEQYVLQEVLPLTSGNPHPFLIAHGCSIGAFHATNIALRRPELFQRIVALSGRYDLTQSAGIFPNLFDGYYSDELYFNTPNHFVPGLTDESVLSLMRRMDIVLTVGEDDPFRGSTELLSEALWRKGVGNHLAIWPGEAHRARCWREMVKQYL